MRTSRFTLSIALLFLASFPIITEAIPTTLRSPTCPVEISQDPPADTSPVRKVQRTKIEEDDPQPRIINGDYLSPALVPYMVLIEKGCTGTLISSRWFISAAHCELKVGDRVFIGVRSSEDVSVDNLRTISRAFSHPSYIDLERGLGDEFDFGVFELDSPAPDGSKFMKVNDNIYAPSAKTFARVMGYGTTIQGQIVPPVARQVDLPITTRKTCENANGAIVDGIKKDKQVCAGYERGGCDSCQGDSGGPMIQYNGTEPVHAGVVSFGAGCAEADQPGVYVRTAAYLDFMEENGVEFERVSLPGEEEKDEVLSRAAIIGIAVGGGVVVLLVLLLLLCCCCGWACFRKR